MNALALTATADVRLVDALDLGAAHTYLANPACGAVNTFVGTVRNHADGRAVTHLIFEAYAPMALRQLRAIAEDAIARFDLGAAILWHALGEHPVGSAVVVVGAAAPHRDAGFAACRYLIDELKARVPIWKKEHFADGSHWVNAHP